MKASIPIIIASILFTALIISTLFYATASTTLLYKRYDTSAGDVEQMRNELASVIILALRNAADEADKAFNEAFMSNWSKPDFGEYFLDGNVTLRTNKTCNCSISVWIYNYSNYSRNCGENTSCDYSTRYSDYNLQGFNKSRDNFKSIVKDASEKAGNVYRRYLRDFLASWSNMRRSLGYTIDSSGDVIYRIIVDHSPMAGSYTIANLTAYVNADIYHPSIGFQRINSTVSIVVNATFYRGWRDHNSSYIPVNITARVYRDGVATTYLLNPGDVRMTLHSRIFNRLNTSLAGVSNGTISPTLSSLYYLSDGLSQTVFRITTNPNMTTYSLTLEVISGLSLSNATLNDVFPPPEEAFPPQQISSKTVTRHVLVFFIAGNLRVYVDRVWIHVPLVMAFKHYFDVNPPGGYDWVSRRVFVLYGDPAIPPPS